MDIFGEVDARVGGKVLVEAGAAFLENEFELLFILDLFTGPSYPPPRLSRGQAFVKVGDYAYLVIKRKDVFGAEEVEGEGLVVAGKGDAARIDGLEVEYLTVEDAKERFYFLVVDGVVAVDHG